MSLVVQFLTGIRTHVLAQNGDELSKNFMVEDTAPAIYYQLAQDLKSSFPPSSDSLEKIVDKCLPEEDDVQEGKGSPWPGFNSFVVDFLEYWRDINFSDISKLHIKLSSLLNACANALANPTYGVMLLQTSMSLSMALSRVVMKIDSTPELAAQIRSAGATLGDEGGESKSIVEMAADIIQKMFTSCLTDRSSTRWSTPKGKKVAVYLFANLTLKLMFACHKENLATQMLTNLASSGPALSLYPASQRVTFLYYLGRFYFFQGDYWRANFAFKEADRQCPPQFLKHRRQILRFWVPTNLLLARFPSQTLLQRPEAVGFAEVYLPICMAIRAGNMNQFLRAANRHKKWLCANGAYLLIISRLRPLVWRSFTRKIFMLTRQNIPDAAKNQAPSLSFDYILACSIYVQRLLEGYTPAAPRRVPGMPPVPPPKRAPHINTLFMKAVTNSAAAEGEGGGVSLLPPPSGHPKKLMPLEGLIYGNMRPNLALIEDRMASMKYAGLLNGFIAHQQQLFVIEGTKKYNGDAVRAGWPNPYQSIVERLKEGWEEDIAAYESGESPDPAGEFDDVPGWVRDATEMGS